MAGLRPVDGRFTVGVSRDFLDADGRNVWGDIRLGELDAAGIDWHYLPPDTDELLALLPVTDTREAFELAADPARSCKVLLDFGEQGAA
ncbi:hypothetical protein [Streptomyces sp. HUAS ZL42]|uniref:hypothetical protein n=1 Tax=Streptomyces sp. HUAS ZL42 TaxID=3231715 RepID=UPI00345E4826